MKVTLITQWFPPEQAPIGYMIKELAEALAAAGHHVTIITGFPSHPTGVVFGGYRKKWMLQEQIGSVNVLRVWLATSASRSIFKRILTFATFTLTSAWALLYQSKPQLIFAVFQPLSVGVTLPLLARLKGAKLILNVQDLHPDVPIELGIVRNPLMIRLLRFVERRGYKKATALTVICDAFKTHCVERGANARTVAVIPNWIDLNEVQPGNRNNSFRASLGLGNEHFVVLYAGTVGWVSGAGIMLEVAYQLRDLTNIRIVFVGEGPLLSDLKAEAKTRKLDNVIFAPFQTRDILPQVQAMSDLSIVSLKAGKGRSSVPSKVLGYMAAARPILASVDLDSETARTILQADCGLVVEPENSEKLALAIRAFHDGEYVAKPTGENGRAFLEKNYSKSSVLNEYIDFFERITYY